MRDTTPQPPMRTLPVIAQRRSTNPIPRRDGRPSTNVTQPRMPGVDTAGGGFRAGAAGSKRYGSGQIAPQRGTITNTSGYAQRDQRMKAQKAALAQRVGMAPRGI